MEQKDYKIKNVFGDRVLIQPDEKKKTTDSGLVIPDTAQQPYVSGKVVKVGSQVTEVVPGEHVGFGPNAGSIISSAGVEYLIMREEDIAFSFN